MNHATLPQAGACPQRPGAADLAGLQACLRALRSRLRPARPTAWPAAQQQRLARLRAQAQALPPERLATTVRAAGRALRMGVGSRAPGAPLPAGTTLRSLVLVAEAMARHNGLRAYDTQLQAAWLMLNGHLVEMATGEGKTLATALAAGVAGFTGAPVHVVTANDYLVERDAQAMAPFFARLGLRCGQVTAATPPGARASTWRHDVVYTTARELAFDHLRDHVALGGQRDGRLLLAQALEAAATQAPAPAPVLPGLWFALVDEADSVLLDEAVVPLVLARQLGADPLDAQAWKQAWRLANDLQPRRHFLLDRAQRQVRLTPAGHRRVDRLVQILGSAAGPLAPTRRGCELVQAALAARLLYRRDHDYLVVRDRVQLIDPLTGRVADGRQWQGALQPMVELKEGLAPSRPTTTAAQITYQRLFPRYLRLGGMSGTLHEDRHELATVYGCPVQAVPLLRPSQRRWRGERVYANSRWKWFAVVRAVQRQHQAGRPVLVGTDSVADSAHLSDLLTRLGLPHQVLNARQDADEAQAMARAGRAGMVTVATNLAGRGTDIRPDEAALRRGGLHVIATMRNRARRTDRQLIGRAARHGDPGSAEAIVALDDGLPATLLPAWVQRLLAWLAPRWPRGRLPPRLGQALMAWAQRRAEAQDATRRRRLRLADRGAAQRHGFAGALE